MTLLDAARGGDEAAYEQLVEPHRAELHAHCYRMLGSVQDAEDALQEALLGAWRGLAALRGPQLAALVALHGRDERLPASSSSGGRKLVLPIDYGPAADPHDGLGEPVLEPLWVEPYPDAGPRATSSARASSSRSSRRSSTCRRASARC